MLHGPCDFVHVTIWGPEIRPRQGRPLVDGTNEFHAAALQLSACRPYIIDEEANYRNVERFFCRKARGEDLHSITIRELEVHAV